MFDAKSGRIGMDLIRFILEEERLYSSATGSLTLALVAIESAAKMITAHVRRAGLVNVLGQTDKINVQGEIVQKLDELADSTLISELSASGQFHALASEESENPIFPQEGEDARYVVAFDPLDGSSNIDCNISIGTIFSILKRNKGTVEDFYQGGKKQVAAGYILYGSSTMLVYSTGNGVNGFTMDPSVGMFLLSHPNISLTGYGTDYSFNEANYPNWDPRIQEYVHSVKTKGFTQRYVGTMVADVHRTLIKNGLFGYPADSKHKNGKLRLLYEAAPMAFLVQQAGGKTSTGTENILDVKTNHIHQRTPVFLGSMENMDEFLSFLT